MRRVLLALFALFFACNVFGATYWWVGGTAGTNTMSDRSNWSTVSVGGTAVGSSGTNITFTSSDILIIDGSDISSTAGLQTGAITATVFTGTPTNIGQLTLLNSASLTISSGGTRVININGGTGVDLDVPSGCTLGTSGSAVTIAVLTGATANIAGTFNLGAGSNAHQITAADAGSVVFANGSTLNARHGSGGPFGTSGTNGGVVFQNGSLYVQNTSSGNPFQLATPNSLVTFETGSTFRQDVSAAPSLSGRTYSNFIWNNTGSQSLTGTGALVMDNLTINAAGTLNINLTSGGVTIKGNITVSAGTLTFSPASAQTITLSGTSTQTITNSSTLTFGANATVSVTNSTTGGVVLGSNVTGMNGTLNIANGGVFDASTFTLSGSGTFNAQSGSTIKVASTAGLTSSGATGNVQTTTRTYNSGANYIFNGTSAQATGNFLNATTPSANTVNNLTISNSAGVTTSAAVTVNGTLSLSNGTFTNSSTVTMANNTTISRANGSIANAPTFGTNVDVTYTGSSADITTGNEIPSSSTVLRNLTINQSSANVIMGGNINVNTGLALTAGKVLSNGNTITLKGTSSSITGSTTFGTAYTSYIATCDNTNTPSSAGGLVIEGIGSGGRTGAVLFPVGPTTSSYNPITINNSSASVAFTVRVNTTAFPGITPSTVSVQRTWNVSPASGSPSAVLNMQWTGAHEGGTFTRASAKVGHYNGSAVDVLGSAVAASGSDPYTSNSTQAFSGYSQFGVTSGTASTPDVALSEISTVGAANIAQATTNNIIYNFKLDVTTSDATLNQLTIPTTGTYTSADLSNLKLWYNTSNNFGSASAIKTITPGGAGTETFGSLSQNITSGNTGYFWITADVAGGATVGRTITVTPAIAQSNFTFSATVNFTTGTINAGGTQTVSAGTSNVTLSRISDVAAGNIQANSTNNIIYNFRLDVTSVAATLTQVVINTSGNYTSSDLTNLKLWYNSSNSFGTASAIKTITPAGATTETFGSLSQSIAIGATGYFWITADVEASPTSGRTITVTPALSFTELSFAGSTSNTTGTINAGGTQTITSTPSVTLSEISTVGAANIAQATNSNIIYNFKLDVTDAAATLTQVVIPTSGDYTSSDLTNLKLWYNSANNFGTAAAIKTITPAGATTETFGSLTQTINSGATGYFWVTADVAGGATVARTITVTPALSFSNLTFSASTNNTTGTINAGGTQTVSAGTSNVTLDEISTVGAANITQGSSSNIIYNFKLAVTSVAATVTQVTIPTTGTYTSSDLTNLKLWYNTSNSFGTASAIKTITPGGAGTETFGSLSQSIAIGATGYFWVTTDVSNSVTAGRTITVTPALAFSNLTFSGSTSNTTGTINAGGTQTITVSSNATDAFRSKATGDWNDATPGNVWESFTNGGWINATLTPGTSAASITIQNTHVITVPNGASISADDITVETGGQITVASGGTLTVANGAASPDITVNGTLKNSGTVTMTGTGTISGASAVYEHNQANLTLPSFTWASSSTLKLTGTYTGTGTAILSAGSYQNITYQGTISSATDYVSFGDNAITIAGKLTVSGSGSGALLTSATGTSPTVAEYEQTSGIVFINRNSASTRSLTVTGNATVSGGTLNIKTLAGAGAGQLIVGGDLTIGASGTLANSGTAGTASLQFNSASAQQWSNAGGFTGSTNGIGVTITGAGGVTLNTDLSFPTSSGTQSSLGLTTGNFTIAASKTFTMSGTQTLTIPAGRTLTVNGTFVYSSTSTTPSTGTMILSSGATYVHNTTASAGNMLTIAAGNIDAASTWIYRGSSTLTPAVALSNRTFGNLHFESTSGSLSAIAVSGTSALTINGNLSVGGAGAGTMALSFSGYTGAINIAGGVTIVASNSFTVTSNSISVGGSWNNSGTFTPGTSTVNFNGSSTQTITKSGGESFYNLTIGNTSNTVTAANNLTSTNTFTTSSGSTLDMGTNTLTVSTVSHSGTLQTQNTSGTPITSGKTWGGTVQYNSASAQTIVSGNYTDLNATGGDRTMASSGTVGIAGTFTAGAGTYTVTGSTVDYNKSSGSQTVVAMTYNNLTLSGASSTKTFAGNSTVSGNFVVTSGTVTAPSIMTFNGGSAQNVAGIDYQTIAFSGAGNKTITSDGSVSTAVTFASGQSATIDFDGSSNDKTFTVKSTATYTARVENKESYTLSGKIKAERYYPAKRAWRLMSAPVSSSGSVYDNWQNGGVTTTGIGTHITGANANLATNGLDPSTQNSTTLYTYNQAGNAWVDVTNTKTVNVSDNAAYFIFIRGDRNSSNLNTTTTSSTTTLHTSGTIKSGDQQFTTNTGTGYTLLGNPYPSPIDFNAVWTDAANGGGAGTTNVLRKFYTYDPNIGDRGGYVTVSWNGSSYDVVPTSGVTSQTQHIQSGQGFFVEADGSGNTNQFTVKESHKSSSNINNVFRPGTQSERLSLILKRTNTNGSVVTMDGILVNFNNNYSKAVNSEDALKFSNFDESISFKRDGKLLSIEAMPLVDAGDTIFINIANMKQRSYEFIFQPSNFNAPGLTAFVEDAYTGTSTPLSLSGNTSLTFSVTSNTATSAAGRFMIVFKSNNPLPVSFVNVKAYEKNNAIQVDWSIASESGVNRYEVEESADAVNFSKSKTVNAKANNNAAVSYSWLDNNINSGANFYRIKSISENGEIKLSPIVKVNIGKLNSGISIYPNPVNGGSFSLQMNNMESGDYALSIYSAAGQQMLSRSFKHTGGSGTQVFVIDKQLKPGVYQLVVQNGKAERMVQTIIIKD